MKAVTDWSDKGTNRYTHNEGGFLSLIRRLKSPSTLSSSLSRSHATHKHTCMHTHQKQIRAEQKLEHRKQATEIKQSVIQRREEAPHWHIDLIAKTLTSPWEQSCPVVVWLIFFPEYLTNRQFCYFQESEVNYKENFYSYINALEQCFPQEQL